MLAAACPIKPGETILDAGCGVGGAGFCVLWRVENTTLTAIEWEKQYADLATENARLNGFENRTTVITADIRDYEANKRADHVIINPPYLEAGRHTPSPDAIRAQALGHQEEDLELEDWIKAAHKLVKSNGSVTIIYPAFGTDKIIQAMGRKFGAVEIFPLFPRAGDDAKRVIIRAIKDRQTGSKIHAGLVLHQEDGAYTAETERALRDGIRLF